MTFTFGIFKRSCTDQMLSPDNFDVQRTELYIMFKVDNVRHDHMLIMVK